MQGDVVSRLRYGGFLTAAVLEHFDNGIFSVSPVEAIAMDPQQRLLLELGYEALHHSHRHVGSCDGGVIGVFVGIQATDFETVVHAQSRISVYAATGFAHAVASGRISFALGMNGPCASYDTACSAGLVALHAAFCALILCECEASLTSGTNLILLPSPCVRCAVAGMTSALGRSHTFDSRADGYARSEGGCAFSMQPRCNQPPLSQLCGSAVRQDGRSASLTAPNGQAQRALRLAARARTSFGATQSGCAEAHGTGTALGDPIEAGSHAAVAIALGDELEALGSMKASVGHSEPAAGIAGLLQLLCQLLHRRMTPNAQLRSLNARVGTALDGAMGALAVQLAHLGREPAQHGSLSSFGYSGTIAHCALLAEHLELHPAASATVLFRRRPYPWPAHPFLLRSYPLSRTDNCATFASPTTGAARDAVGDHVVRHRVTFPGAGYLEVGRSACCAAASTPSAGAGFRSVFVVQPLFVEAQQLWIECAVWSGTRFEVSSGCMAAGALQERSVHSTGEQVVQTRSGQFNVALRRSICALQAVTAPMYSAFDSVGLQYGPAFRRLSKVWLPAAPEQTGVLVTLHPREPTSSGAFMHPADLDCTQHLEWLIASAADRGRPRLPFAYGEVSLLPMRSQLSSVRERAARLSRTAVAF